MSRSVPEWIGKDDNAEPPPRVRRRVYLKFGRTCQICFTEIVSGPEFDHRIAIINGGKNAESNLQPVHPKCHKAKTGRDIAEKSATYKTQLHHYGLKKPRRPMPGSRASPFKKRMDGTVELRKVSGNG